MDSRSPRWPLARIASALLAAAAVALAATACGGSKASAPAKADVQRDRRGDGSADRVGLRRALDRDQGPGGVRGQQPRGCRTRCSLHLIQDIAPAQTPGAPPRRRQHRLVVVAGVARRSPGRREVHADAQLAGRGALPWPPPCGAAHPRRRPGGRQPHGGRRRGRRHGATGSAAARWPRWSWATSPSSTAASAGTRSAGGKPVPGRPHDYDPAAFARDYSSFCASAARRAAGRAQQRGADSGWPSWARSWRPSPASGW